MSMKRAASNVLNHDNWDKEDPKENEVIGTFKPAPKEVLEKRVMRTARRRTQVSNDERKKGAFTGFGFNKTQPSSFDFLANLTSQPNINSENSALFTNKPLNSSMFNTPVSSGTSISFGNTGAPANPAPSLFQMPSKNENTSSGLFGGQPNVANSFASPAPVSNNVVNFGSPPQAASSLFKMPSNNESTPSSSLFGNKTASNNTSPVTFGTFGSTNNTTTNNGVNIGTASKPPLFQMPSNTGSSVSTSLFGNKPTASSMFGAATSKSDNADKTGTPPNLFQMPSNEENKPSGLFGNKATPTGMFGAPISTSNNTANTDTSPKNTSTLFQMPNTENNSSSSVFGNKPNSNVFSFPVSNNDNTVKTDTPPKTTSSLFQMPQNSEKTSSSNLFGNKTSPSVPFGLPASSNNTDKIESSPKTTSTVFQRPSNDEKTTSSGLFGKSTASGLFGLSASSSNNFTSNGPTPNTTTVIQVSASNTVKPTSIFAVPEGSAFKQQSNVKAETSKVTGQELNALGSANRVENNKGETECNSYKLHSRLKALNTAMLNWITLHVKNTPSCVLSPIFDDYNKHVKSIREKYDEDFEHYKGPSDPASCKNMFGKGENKTSVDNGLEAKKSVTSEAESKKSVTETKESVTKPQFSFGIKNPQPSTGATSSLASSIFGENAKPPTAAPQTFTFGIKTNTSTDTKKENTVTEGETTTATASSSSTDVSKTDGTKTNDSSSKAENSGSATFSFGSTSTTTTKTNDSSKAENGGSATFSFGSTSNTTTKTNDSLKAENGGSATFSFGSTSTTTDATASTFSFTAKMSSPVNKVEPFAVKNVTTTTTEKGSIFSFNTSGPSPFSSLSNKSPFSATSSESPFGSTNTVSTSSAPFSFGIGKPFSFNSSVEQNKESGENAEENEEPPKVEYTPVKEDNSVFEKKCKIFIKKEDNYIDKGVGTLYIKKVENSEKYQLLVRANTNLGTVLVNLILVSAIPAQRMGKNNVMLVCIPTPDTKPPPTPILIRVKTSTEADELLETINKYKV